MTAKSVDHRVRTIGSAVAATIVLIGLQGCSAIHFVRGNIAEALGNDKEAVDAFTAAIEIHPKSDALAYFKRGTCYMDLGNYKSALSDYDEATNIIDSNQGRVQTLYYDIPLSAMVLNNRAWTNCLLGNYSKAIPDCNKSISFYDSYESYHTYDTRGFAYLGMKQYDRAINDFTKAIALAPTEAAISYFHRASAYTASGQKHFADLDRDKAQELGYKPETK